MKRITEVGGINRDPFNDLQGVAHTLETTHRKESSPRPREETVWNQPFETP